MKKNQQTIPFSEILIGQEFSQCGCEVKIRKTENAAHNQAGRGVITNDEQFPKNTGMEITVPQNRRCTLSQQTEKP